MADVYGTEGADQITRREQGSETIYGLGGNDMIEADNGRDTIYGGDGDDLIAGDRNRDVFGLITAFGEAGSDIFAFGYGETFGSIDGGTGIDTIEFLFNRYVVYLASPDRHGIVDQYEGGEYVGLTNINSIENVIGGLGNDKIVGNGERNVIEGGGGSDYILGEAGADTLNGDGRQGGDRARDGSRAIDTASYETSSAGVLVGINGRGRGGDAEGDVLSGFENLVGSQHGDELQGDGFGNRLGGLGGDDTIKGFAGDDVLDGGAGADLLQGSVGNDVYIIDEFDIVDETTLNANGLDRVESAGSVDISNASRFKGGIEDILLTGTAAANATGNDLANTITGNGESNVLAGGGGGDTLIGGGGRDILRGGSGDDTYVVDSRDDVVDEGLSGSSGLDTVRSAVSFSLVGSPTLFGDVENLVLTGTEASSGTGNGLANAITGNDGANLLNGGIGNDALSGGGGIDRLLGGTGDDRLDGGAAADILRGGAGDDTYLIDATDQVDESVAGSSGIDTVVADFTVSLTGNARLKGDIENLRLAGTGNFNATGNALDNVINGNRGVNALFGLDGDDTFGGEGGGDKLYGGRGDDTYFLNSDDTIIENAGEGSDRLIFFYGASGFTLGAGVSVEVMEMDRSATATARDLTGNEIAQTLRGNGFANALDGGGGADRMVGYAGNDSYHVDAATDRVFEARNEGSDTVYASVSYGLAAGQEIEELRIAVAAGDRAINLTGNEFAQTIRGNGGANRIDGAGGADMLVGGAGNDTYLVDTAGDRVIEAAGGGRDAVATSVNYTLGAGQKIEELRIAVSVGDRSLDLTGNSVAQTLIGNGGANVLNGAWGNDVLTGRGGADTFVFANALGAGNVDRITDFASEDTIRLSDAIFTALAPGSLAAGAFKNLSTGTVDASDRILYQQSTGELFYDSDGSGGRAAVKFAVLDNKAALTAADFLIA